MINKTSVQVPIGAGPVVQRHVRPGETTWHQDARQRSYNQDFKLELENEENDMKI